MVEDRGVNTVPKRRSLTDRVATIQCFSKLKSQFFVSNVKRKKKKKKKHERSKKELVKSNSNSNLFEFSELENNTYRTL